MKIYLSAPTIHDEELRYVKDACDTNLVSSVGENIRVVERMMATKTGCQHTVALSSGTAALHMAIKLAGVKPGDKVFCSDLTSAATVNPILYEGGVPVFVDSEYDTWNMDPEALIKAFELYPEVKVVVLVHLYGTPAKIPEIKEICDRHRAILIEDAAESFGAFYKSEATGYYGRYGCISFDGNKIITGSSGGMFLTNDKDAADRVRKWSALSLEPAPWYQHEEPGYNYRMNNIAAGMVRGQLTYLELHITYKKNLYMRYKEAFRDLPVFMNPYDETNTRPNFWISCLLINKAFMCRQDRTDREAHYFTKPHKTCPTEILEMLEMHEAEGRPIWKPMHLQPIFRDNPFVTCSQDDEPDVASDIFERALCLPSDINMMPDEQDKVIRIVRKCFE